jgi:threonine aldolase
MAAQILALVEDGLWLDLASHANAAAAEIAAGAGERVLFAPQSNEVFVRLTSPDRAALRAQGFAFYDWDEGTARFVCSWDTKAEHATALGRAIGML